MFGMFSYSAKNEFTLGGIFDAEYCQAAGTCSIIADSLESEECAVLIHGIENGQVAIGGAMFTKLIDWWNLPIIIQKRMPNIKKIYLVSCFNGLRRSMNINGIKLIVPKKLRVNRPISTTWAAKIHGKRVVIATGSKLFLVMTSVTAFFLGIAAYYKLIGVKQAAKEMFKVSKKIWTDYILA